MLESDLRRPSGAARQGTTGRRLLGGAVGNNRLTSLLGVILLVGLAVEGATIPSIRSLLSVHIFVGMLLLGPVAVKLASTGYRFARYYTGSVEYVRLGPPLPNSVTVERTRTGATRNRISGTGGPSRTYSALPA